MTGVSEGNVLVTGGTGLIGSHVARLLLKEGMRPVLFDAVPSIENVSDIRDRVEIERGDVSDMSDLLDAARRHAVTHVIHLAAVLTIQAALKPARGVGINCIGTSNVFLLARLLGMKRVVYASSAAVYAPRPYYESLLGRHLVSENDPPMPGDLYGATKYLCEGLAGQEIRNGVDIVGLRPVMTFGVGRLNGAVGILNQAVRDATLTGRGIVTQPWQPNTSINPMYVKDCADMFVRTCLRPQRLRREVYNLGTGEYLNIREMMDIALKALPRGASIEFENVASIEGGETDVPVFNYADLDSTALRSELDWTPAYGFEAGMRESIDIYKASR